MAKYGMVIDLGNCVGCGVCALACKSENNTEYKQGGSTYNWADLLTVTSGKYSDDDVLFSFYPVLCNHCTDAPCVAICPVDPKAMYKTADGITMHNEDRCIGCQQCQDACPYSSKDVDADGDQYSVITFNPSGSNTHTFWDNTTEIITDGTSSPSDIITLAGVTPPNKNEYTHTDYSAVRRNQVTEKCIFCDHRLQNGDDPYCVESCPTHARTFGDLDDPTSKISKLLAKYKFARLKNSSGEFLGSGETGTDPNVYYINHPSLPTFKTEKVADIREPLRIYPNPATDNTKLEFYLRSDSKVTLSVFSISGKQIMQPLANEHRTEGKHIIGIDVHNLEPGTYICRLQAGTGIQTANLVVVRGN